MANVIKAIHENQLIGSIRENDDKKEIAIAKA